MFVLDGLCHCFVHVSCLGSKFQFSVHITHLQLLIRSAIQQLRLRLKESNVHLTVKMCISSEAALIGLIFQFPLSLTPSNQTTSFPFQKYPFASCANIKSEKQLGSVFSALPPRETIEISADISWICGRPKLSVEILEENTKMCSDCEMLLIVLRNERSRC